MGGSGSVKRRNSLRKRGMKNMPAFWLQRVERAVAISPQVLRKNFIEKVIPGQTIVGMVAAQYRTEAIATGRRPE
jgi:hypothetical protein